MNPGSAGCGSRGRHDRAAKGRMNPVDPGFTFALLCSPISILQSESFEPIEGDEMKEGCGRGRTGKG